MVVVLVRSWGMVLAQLPVVCWALHADLLHQFGVQDIPQRA